MSWALVAGLLVALFLPLERVSLGRQLSGWFHRARPTESTGAEGSSVDEDSRASFHCPSCSRTFSWFSAWDEHVRLNHAR
ncbi:MAG: hypothetical protein L3J95_04285 [Thermoplasmata archaeon]|nr:hypothetical protein [Thermoplasmata archaeon]MCI4359625.1 hypothetical protein [Thermoplasmata archaeon]